MVNAVCPHGLASTGSSPLWPSAGNSLPMCQLHRPLPILQNRVYMVDGGYTVDEILKAERFMLSMLQFELGWPGPMSFLRRISKADDYDLETRTLAKYFLEVTIMDERFIGSPPSFAAAGAHCLARMMLRKGNWV